MDSAEEIEKSGKPEKARPYTEALLKSRLVQTTKPPLPRPHTKALPDSRIVRLVVVNGVNAPVHNPVNHARGVMSSQSVA
jgi:hypothetical protein